MIACSFCCPRSDWLTYFCMIPGRMQNLYENIVSNPQMFRQFHCGETLLTVYNCPLRDKFVDIWSQYNYIVYVKEGKKIWHTPDGSFELKKGSFVLIRKGAYIVEQFFDAEFCLVLFFMTDEFICNVLKSRSVPLSTQREQFDQIMPLAVSPSVEGFYDLMLHYFNESQQPDPALLELKFRELILLITENKANEQAISYFCSLARAPQAVSLQRVMEENFTYNLKLEEFARLSSRSLSAFKRDFQKVFQTTPGKWLMEKRLQYAYHLLTNEGKTVSEASFDSGFENTSHFSRSFRVRFGFPPAQVKQLAGH